MQQRSQQDRRTDRSTAERFDLAILAARAFNLRAGQQYLVLSGVSPSLVGRFVAGFPDEVRMRMLLDRPERRLSHTCFQANGKARQGQGTDIPPKQDGTRQISKK